MQSLLKERLPCNMEGLEDNILCKICRSYKDNYYIPLKKDAENIKIYRNWKYDIGFWSLGSLEKEPELVFNRFILKKWKVVLKKNVVKICKTLPLLKAKQVTLYSTEILFFNISFPRKVNIWSTFCSFCELKNEFCLI